MERSGATARLLVTADDFGLCPEVDEAVCLLHDRGLLQRTSFLVNLPGFDRSRGHLAARRGLRVGVHLNLTDGPPVLPPSRVPSLVNAAGTFVGGRHYRVLAGVVGGWFSRAEIRSEWRAQLAKARDAGLAIDHLDAHGHLHLLPGLQEVVLDLMTEFAIPFLRLFLSVDSARHMALQPWSVRLARRVHRRELPIVYPRRVLGLRRQGALDVRWLRDTLASAPPVLTELIVHPARGRNDYHHRWGYAGERELAALLAPEIEPLLRQRSA